MVFEQFQKDLCNALGVDVTVQYGCCGTNYTKILAIKEGKIIEIGEFTYRTWQERSRYTSTKNMLKAMLPLAIKFYHTGIGDVPCLHTTDYPY